MRRIFSIAIAAVLLSACSSQQHDSTSAAPTAGPPLANPIAFPLYSGSRVIEAHEFTQVVTANASGSSLLSAGKGNYKGHEVVATTSGSFAQLNAWLKTLDAKPPKNFTHVSESNLETARGQVHQLGLDFSVFQSADGKGAGLLVVVMDPPRVAKRLGPVLGLLGKYRSLPSFLRSQVDDEVKARTGFTVSEALQPESPIGASLAALDQLQQSNARGIVMVDAIKQ